MSNNVTLPGTGVVVETLDIGAGTERQVITISPRDLSTGDSIGTLTETAPATDTASSGLNGRLQRVAQRITSLIALLPGALGAGGGLKVDGSGTALPVSGTFWPTTQPVSLPLGQTTMASSTPVAIASNQSALAVTVPVGQAVMASSTPVVIASNQSGVAVTVPVGQTTMSASTPVAIASNQSVIPIAGNTASGASDADNPIKIGGLAKTANPTAVTDGQRVAALHDKLGKQVVVGSIRDLKGSQFTTITSSTAETTVVTAVAATFLDIYGVIIENTSAAACKVTFKDSTAGTTRFEIYVPAGDTRGFMLPESGATKQAAVNNNWTATCGTSVASIVITIFYIQNL